MTGKLDLPRLDMLVVAGSWRLCEERVPQQSFQLVTRCHRRNILAKAMYILHSRSYRFRLLTLYVSSELNLARQTMNTLLLQGAQVLMGFLRAISKG